MPKYAADPEVCRTDHIFKLVTSMQSRPIRPTVCGPGLNRPGQNVLSSLGLMSEK